jgi:hypothetical protein
LARALASLLGDPRREAIGQQGQRHVTTHFTWSCVAERMEAAYHGLVTDRLARD